MQFTDGWDGGHVLPQLELVQDGCLARGIEAHLQTGGGGGRGGKGQRGLSSRRVRARGTEKVAMAVPVAAAPAVGQGGEGRAAHIIPSESGDAIERGPFKACWEASSRRL